MIIELPESLPKTEFSETLIASEVIRTAVMTLPFWKEGAELTKIDAFLEIQDALDSEPMRPSICADTRNLLKEAMTLKLPNSNYASINDDRTNRFYMRIYRAVVVAKDEKKT